MKRLSYTLTFAAVALILSSCASLYIQSGETAYEELKYEESISLLEKGLAKKEDFDARMKLAEAYMQTSQYSKAADSYAIASVEPSMTDKDRIEYGKALMAAEKYDKALEIFNAILSRDQGNPIATELASSCKNIGALKRDSSLYNVKIIDISGFQSTYAPIPYEDGIIVSAEKSIATNKDPYTGWSFTDLYYVKKNGDSWESPREVEGVNGTYHDAAPAITSDGKIMYFTRSNADGRKLNGDGENVSNMQIYFASKTNSGVWTEPRSLPFNDANFMFAHPTLSEDGKTMIFSSNKGGGFGGMDLYKTTLNETNWSTPENLGANINSAGDEVFPYLMTGDTLYFSSDSHTGLGGLDILYSVNRGGEWSKPYHLSYPMNTAADDFGVNFTESSKKGYLSSNRLGGDRIYSFEIFNPDLRIEGLVTSKDNMLPIGGATVTVINITDGTEEVIYTDENGEFEYELQPGKNYRVKVEDDGFFTQTKEVSTVNKTSSEDIPLIFEMEELIVSDPNNTGGDDVTDNNTDGNNDKLDKDGLYTYAVPNIYWDYNKWDVRPDAEPYLNQLVAMFRDNPNLKIEIRSHCDCRGSYPFNDELSDKRATAVVDYLVAKGVRRGMLISKGYGERKLVNGCKDGVECSEEQHQENRRTEFIVLKK